MLSAIAHRGPDHSGTFVENGIALGNQRLKIIDLAGGDQPITNEDGSVVVVYNGEIYNFAELREELQERGHAFRSRTDTEVLVHLYEEEGIDFLTRLNGIFAFALYDRRSRELFLARDRFGVKPLFYETSAAGLHFASEINALRTRRDFRDELDPEALALYLTLSYIPQPWTIYAGTRRLEAGQYMRVVDGKPDEPRTYFDIDFTRKIRIDAREAEEEVLRRLSVAVRRQLVADVPTGVFLSGGLDSCSLLAFGREHGASLDTFTLSFENPEYDENPDAERWARFFGAKHHRVILTESDLFQLVDDRPNPLGEPICDLIHYGQIYVAQRAYDAGFKVMLSGAGGDELFCGYPTLNAAVAAGPFRWLPRFVIRALASLANRLPAGRGDLPLTFKLKAFLNAIDPDSRRTFMNFKVGIAPSEYPRLLSPDMARQLSDFDPFCTVTRWEKRIEGWPLVDALQYLDFKNFFEGSVLKGGDNASMAASVEERVPFLDNDLVDFACSLPVSVKFRLPSVKRVLRSALRRYLLGRGAGPLLGRYKKRGYWLPANQWLRDGRLRARFEERLLSPASPVREFFDVKGVRALLDDHVSGRQNNERKLQSLLGLIHFLEARQAKSSWLSRSEATERPSETRTESVHPAVAAPPATGMPSSLHPS